MTKTQDGPKGVQFRQVSLYSIIHDDYIHTVFLLINALEASTIFIRGTSIKETICRLPFAKNTEENLVCVNYLPVT
jgi:hypothetical protein